MRFIFILAIIGILSSLAFALPGAIPTLTPSKSVLDTGQTEILTANVVSGVSPYTVNFYNVTSGSPLILKTQAAAKFDGGSSDIAPGTNNVPTGASPSSAFAWIYISGGESSFPFIYEYGTFSGGTGTAASLFIFGLAGPIAFDAGGTDYSSSLVPSQNAWHLVGWSYSGGTSITIYLDGVSNVISIPMENVVISESHIGSIHGSEEFFNGGISNLQVYNTALSATQVSALYSNGMSAKPILPSNIVGWWPLINSANDVSGNGNNGIPTSIVYTTYNAVFGTPNSVGYSFVVHSTTPNNNFEYNAVAIDSVSSISNSIASTITVNPLPTPPTITPSTPSSYASGNVVTVTAYESSGTAPYTYNFIVFNSVTHLVIANQLSTSNSFSLTSNLIMVGQSLQANVIVTDNVLASANSINSALISILAVPTQLICATNGQPNINSTFIYQNTNSSSLAIFADSHFSVVGSYSNTPLVSEVVNSTGSTSIIYSASVVDTILSGNNPEGIAINPTNTLMYIANYGDGTVSVVNVVTNSVINTINLGLNNSHPYGMVFRPDGSLAYVTDHQTNSISVINVATNTVINNITVSPSTTDPQGIGITPDGTLLYVANNQANNVSVIDTATNTAINNVIVGSSPTGVAISPDGTLAYVTNQGDATVSVIDIATNSVINVISVQSGPNYISFLSNGKFAYIANEGTDIVSVIDVATNSVVKYIVVGSGPYGTALDNLNQFLYVANQNDQTVSIVNVASNTTIATVPIGSAPNYVTVNPVSGLAYITNAGGNTTSVVQLKQIITYSNQSTTLIIPPRYYLGYTYQPTSAFHCNWIAGGGGGGSFPVSYNTPNNSNSINNQFFPAIGWLYFMIGIFTLVLALELFGLIRFVLPLVNRRKYR